MNGTLTSYEIDTGADFSFQSGNAWERLNPCPELEPCSLSFRSMIATYGTARPNVSEFANSLRYGLYLAYEALAVIKDILYHIGTSPSGEVTHRPVLPSEVIHEVLQLAHSNILSGHLGINRTYERVRDRFFRPHLKQLVTDFVKSCHTCQVSKNPTKSAKAPLRPIFPSHPMQVITSDVIGKLPRTDRGCIFIILFICHFTKWISLHAVKSVTAVDTAKELIKFL